MLRLEDQAACGRQGLSDARALWPAVGQDGCVAVPAVRLMPRPLTPSRLVGAAEEAPVRIPISVKFEIPYFTVSGIQVRYLKIVEKSGYQALPWVRYITQQGDDYSLRTVRRQTFISCSEVGNADAAFETYCSCRMPSRPQSSRRSERQLVG